MSGHVLYLGYDMKNITYLARFFFSNSVNNFRSVTIVSECVFSYSLIMTGSRSYKICFMLSSRGLIYRSLRQDYDVASEIFILLKS